ncbi:MAG: twin-arginine translocation signal domain-containing protein [Planctomycetota bacterium]
MNRVFNRREFLKTVGLGAVALSGFAVADNTRDSRPNIVSRLSDDHRFDAIGCMGNRHVKTPTNASRVSRIRSSILKARPVSDRLMSPSNRVLWVWLAPNVLNSRGGQNDRKNEDEITCRHEA